MSLISAELKKALHDQCVTIVEERIARGQWRMEQVKEAENVEVKSSMGDKYETTRAMLNQEKEQAATQIEEAMKLKETLTRVHTNALVDKVSLGCVIFTNHGKFYLSTAIGKFKYEGEDYFAISAISPIARKMMGLEKGESFSLNNRIFEIQELA